MDDNDPTIAVMETALIKTNSFSNPILDKPEFVEIRKHLGYGITTGKTTGKTTGIIAHPSPASLVALVGGYNSARF